MTPENSLPTQTHLPPPLGVADTASFPGHARGLSNPAFCPPFLPEIAHAKERNFGKVSKYMRALLQHSTRAASRGPLTCARANAGSTDPEAAAEQLRVFREGPDGLQAASTYFGSITSKNETDLGTFFFLLQKKGPGLAVLWFNLLP